MSVSPIPFLLQDIPPLNQQVFGQCDLSDSRRERRLLELGLGHLYFPGQTLRRMFPCPAQSKAAYRFIENSEVPVETLMKAVTQAGARACADHEIVHILNDTTTVDFSGRAPLEGMGPLNTRQAPGQGFFLHSSLALTEQGAPLGLLAAQRWARDPEKLGQREKRKQRPFAEKESSKWTQGMEQSETVLQEVLGEAKPTRRVYVGDREMDVYQVFQKGAALKVGLLVRAARNRRVLGEARHLWPTLQEAEVGLGQWVKVKAQKDQPARTARVEIRWREVTLLPPPGVKKPAEPIRVWAVWVREIQAPKGVKGLDWMLLSTEAVETAAAAENQVRVYRQRQRVEDWHLILKSGCRIEEVQYESRENVERALALKLVPALRILALRHWGQTAPETPARAVLDEEEEATLKQVVKEIFHREAESLTVKDVWEYIGRLGGHVQWQKEKPAGVRSLWRGWERFQLMVEGFRLARRLRSPTPFF